MFKRNCKECYKEIIYKNIGSFNRAMKQNSLCKSCAKMGKRNSFYGKHHSDKTKSKLREKSSKQIHTKLSREKRSIRMTGSDNSMYGRSVYDLWIEKYGKKEANKRMVELKHKHSVNNSGKGNPMYGKPSPQGSGNGWSGWYKKWYFRSLRELSYVINYLEENDLEWISAEKKKFTIPYKDYDGTEKTYRPDFFVENKRLVEVKPNRLKQAVTNSLKAEAAKKFCKENGYEYEMVEAIKMKDDQILDLYKKGLIVFIERYKKKFEERYLNE